MKAQYILPAVVLIGAAAMSSLFIVTEKEKALVLQFGQVTQVKETPGLGFKIPLIQEVVRYDDRILGLPTQPLEVTPLDDRRLVVDAFARWRITNLVDFREAVGAGGGGWRRRRKPASSRRAEQTRYRRWFRGQTRSPRPPLPARARR